MNSLITNADRPKNLPAFIICLLHIILFVGAFTERPYEFFAQRVKPALWKAPLAVLLFFNDQKLTHFISERNGIIIIKLNGQPHIRAFCEVIRVVAHYMCVGTFGLEGKGA